MGWRSIMGVAAAAGIALSTLTAAPVTAGAATAAADDPPAVHSSMQVVGGSHGGVTYQGLYDGGKPDAVWFPPEQQLSLSAYWVNYNAYGPDGYPAPGAPEGNVTYYWTAWCQGDTYQLTQPKTSTVPVDSSAHVTRVRLPTRVTTDVVTLPDACHVKASSSGYHGRVTLNHDTGRPGRKGASMIWFTSVPPDGVPEWDPSFGADGKAILFRVGKEGEVEEVERSGHLSGQPLGKLRYFFTNCDAARSALQEISKDVSDKIGIIRVKAPSDLLEDKVAGVTGDGIVGWAIGKVMSQRLEADVVEDPENDCEL